MSVAATLHTYLGYRDALAALDWLEKAFGFRTLYAFPDDNGVIQHSEMAYGDAAFVVFTDVEGYDRPKPKGDTVGQGIYLSVADTDVVDALYASGVAAGGTVVWEPAGTEWGNYRCRFRDPEGIEWTFGTHRPGVVPDAGDWSGDGLSDEGGSGHGTDGEVGSGSSNDRTPEPFDDRNTARPARLTLRRGESAGFPPWHRRSASASSPG